MSVNAKPKMRSSLDRVRHAIIFEGLLLFLTVVLLTGILNQPATHMGSFGIIMALIAMVWNYIYNYLFDHAMVYLKNPLYPRGFRLRVFHAVSFELGLMLASVPFTMIWMNFTLFQALGLDIAFTIAVLFYTLIFNYTYDMIFPIPQAIT